MADFQTIHELYNILLEENEALKNHRIDVLEKLTPRKQALLGLIEKDQHQLLDMIRSEKYSPENSEVENSVTHLMLKCQQLNLENYRYNRSAQQFSRKMIRVLQGQSPDDLVYSTHSLKKG